MVESIMELDSKFRESFSLKEVDLKTFSPLTLAYIGDAVYELMIRSIIVEHGNAPVNKLHKRSSRLVKAQTQAEAAVKLLDVFTEEEMAEAQEALAEEMGYADVDAMIEDVGADAVEKYVMRDVVKRWLAENCIQVKE